jgi:hypothetical protein
MFRASDWLDRADSVIDGKAQQVEYHVFSLTLREPVLLQRLQLRCPSNEAAEQPAAAIPIPAYIRLHRDAKSFLCTTLPSSAAIASENSGPSAVSASSEDEFDSTLVRV